MPKKRNILYISHVPWEWIKQRPHFIAEYLSDEYEIDFVYPKRFNKDNLVYQDKCERLNLIELKRLPLDRFSFVSNINTRFFRKSINRIINDKKYDIIWFTFPFRLRQSDYSKMSNSRIIYDCMDDIIAFPQFSDLQKNILFEDEKLLCKNCKIIFVSSNNLKNKIVERNALQNKNIILVENGVSSGLLSNCKFRNEKTIHAINKIKIIYIGTISKWMDFDLLINSLKVSNEIEYIFFGPKEVQIPNNIGLIYGGILEYENVFKTMKKADILIMPFIINDLILSVNPIKMYEYILAYKPILSIRYPETEKFSKYSYLYKSQRDFNNKLRMIIKSKFKMNETFKSHYNFVKKNSWDERIKVISKVLNNDK